MTRQQARLLEILKLYSAAHNGVMPSFDDMASALGIRSKSGVFRLVEALERQGAIVRTKGMARAIKIVEDGLIDAPTDRALRLYCASTIATRSEVVCDALREYFDKRKFSTEERDAG